MGISMIISIVVEEITIKESMPEMNCQYAKLVEN